MTTNEKKKRYDELEQDIRLSQALGPKNLIESLKRNYKYYQAKLNEPKENLRLCSNPVSYDNMEFWRFIDLDDILALIQKKDHDREIEIEKMKQEQLDLFK